MAGLQAAVLEECQGAEPEILKKKPGVGNISGKASVVEIQETLLAETLPEGIHILGSRGDVE